MDHKFLTVSEAAIRLGIARTTLYDWLGQSDRGILHLQGRAVTIDYFQSGSQGQGRIQIDEAEVGRLRELMRVRPQRTVIRRCPIQRQLLPGIKVKLGHPDRPK